MNEDSYGFDWRQLRTAHGDAAHVPAAIREMLGGDLARQEEAYWRLDNHVVLQGDLYEAAAAVAWVLTELIRERKVEHGRYWLYLLLWELRNGSARPGQQVHLPDGRQLPLGDACESIIDGALPHYLEDCMSPDPRVRKAALELVTSMEQTSEAVADLLSGALRSTNLSPDVRQDLQDALESTATP